MKLSKKLLSLVAITAIATSAFAGGPTVLKQKQIDELKKEFPSLIGGAGVNVVKGIDQGKFKQLQIEVMTPRGPQKFEAFVVKGVDAVFVGTALKATGEKYSLPVNTSVIKDGVLMKVGTGPEQLYLVTDPECPYCQKLESGLAPDVGSKYTINVIPMPLSFHKNSKPMLYWVLSAEGNAEQTKRLHAVMTGDKTWESFKPTAEQQSKAEGMIAKSLAAATELNAGGTPSLFNSSFEKDQIEKLVKPELLQAPDPKK